MSTLSTPTTFLGKRDDLTSVGAITTSPDVNELSEEQIQQLLDEAQQRLAKQQNPKLSNSSHRVPKLRPSGLEQPYLKTEGKVARVDPARLVDSKTKALADGGVRKVEDPVVLKRKIEENKKATAGPQWFDLPRTKLTPELKRDIQLLKMRSVLDPKRFYKKENSKAKPPEFFQIGTVIEGPTDFYSSRLKNKDRNETFTEEILAEERENKRLKRKYAEIQITKASGKKGYYKALLEKKRRKGRR